MKFLELAGAVILKENKILLIHRNTPNLKQWELPGGKLEKGELPEEAAKRELKEELDVMVTILKYLGNEEFPDEDLLLKYHWYLAEIKEGVPKLMETKFDKINYFTKEELEKRTDLSSNMKVLLEAVGGNKIWNI